MTGILAPSRRRRMRKCWRASPNARFPAGSRPPRMGAGFTCAPRRRWPMPPPSRLPRPRCRLPPLPLPLPPIPRSPAPLHRLPRPPRHRPPLRPTPAALPPSCGGFARLFIHLRPSRPPRTRSRMRKKHRRWCSRRPRQRRSKISPRTSCLRIRRNWPRPMRTRPPRQRQPLRMTLKPPMRTWLTRSLPLPTPRRQHRTRPMRQTPWTPTMRPGLLLR